MNNADLYETDIMLWAEHQADAFRRRAINELDWEKDRRRGLLIT